MGPYLDMSWHGLESAEDPIPLYLTLEEYERSVFRPDVDFVDGQTENRNVGESPHSRVLTRLICLLAADKNRWRVEVLPTCRLRVAATRVRVPDVMVIRPNRDCEQIVSAPPIVCIEVISPDDTWSRLRVKFEDYLAMGVEQVWSFDPIVKEVRRYTSDGFVRMTEPELAVPGRAVRVRPAEVFSDDEE